MCGSNSTILSVWEQDSRWLKVWSEAKEQGLSLYKVGDKGGVSGVWVQVAHGRGR